MRPPPTIQELKAIWPDFDPDVHETDWPRFDGCPPICEMENLPAFLTDKEAKTFHAKVSPSNEILELWRCRYCGGWHYIAACPDLSGQTSGTTRTQKHH